MSNLTPLALTLLILAFPIWAAVQTISNALRAARRRKTWWGQLILGATPFVSGVGVCFIPGGLDFLLELCGWEGEPITWGVRLFTGVFAGAAATTLHAVGARKLAEEYIGRGLRKLLGAKTTVLAMATLLIGSCATAGGAWPDNCPLVRRADGQLVRRCACSHLQWTIDPLDDRPSPGGLVTPVCDGTALPFQVGTEQVEVPR